MKYSPLKNTAWMKSLLIKISLPTLYFLYFTGINISDMYYNVQAMLEDPHSTFSFDLDFERNFIWPENFRFQ